LEERVPVVWEPLTGLLPDQPPDAAQEVAFVADHLRVELPPLFTDVGLADSATTGDGDFTVTVADCAALAPSPLHVRV
jgi:hypothetical protein